MEQEFVSEAEKLKSEGVVSEYYITNSNEDINKQISDMQDLITKKVDAIVIICSISNCSGTCCRRSNRSWY